MTVSIRSYATFWCFFYRLLFQTPEFNDFTLGLRDEVDDVNRQIKVGVRCKWLYMFMLAD